MVKFADEEMGLIDEVGREGARRYGYMVSSLRGCEEKSLLINECIGLMIFGMIDGLSVASRVRIDFNYCLGE